MQPRLSIFKIRPNNRGMTMIDNLFTNVDDNKKDDDEKNIGVVNIRKKNDPITLSPDTRRREWIKTQTIVFQDEKKEKEETKSFRQILDTFLSTDKRKQNIQAFSCLCALLSSIFYILCTYFPTLFYYLNIFDYGFCFIFMSEYMIFLVLAHHRINFVMTYESLLDLLTSIPPIFVVFIDNLDILNCINVCRVFRIIRFFRIFNLYKSGENDVKRQIWMIINTLITLVLISSGIIQIVEKHKVEEKIFKTSGILQRNILFMRTQFHHYIYFTMVTISSVGFGDIIPYTNLGRLIVMGLILLTLVLIPKQTNDLIQLMTIQSDYARKKYTASHDVSHIILTGDITLDSLKSFCQELFHMDHGTQYRHAVIINSQLPSREMEYFLNEKGNESRIIYLEGDPMNEKDLLRADICKAKACIIFIDKNSVDSFSSDHKNILLGINIKKFVFNINNKPIGTIIKKDSVKTLENLSNSNTNFRLCIQLIKPESRYHYFNSLQAIYKKRMPPDQLILIEEFKMHMLSKSCITPGILALVSNLLMSSSELPSGTHSDWLREYSEGRGHEIYRIVLSDFYKTYSFLDLVKEIYSQAQAILFAIEFEIDKITVIKMNPGDTLTINNIILNLFENKNYFDGDYKEANKSTGKESYSSKQSFYREENSDYYEFIKAVDAKVKVYAYLICSDKSEADSISNKDKDDDPPNKSYYSSTNLNSNPVEQKKRRYIKSQSFLLDNEEDEDSDNSENEDNEILNGMGEGLEISPNDYFLKTIFKDEYISDSNIIDIMQHSINDLDDIVNHVIVCGMDPALIHFILPLRAKYLGEENLKYIVILAPHLPQNLYELFKKFPKIIYIQGSPLLPENLHRAKVNEADKAVILSLGEKKREKFKNKSDANIEDGSDQMLDAETILIYKAIRKCNKQIQIMTELIYTNNVEYLLHKDYLQSNILKQDSIPPYEFTPIFAAGEVFTPSIIDRITCQSYYSPHILTIVDQILNAGTRGKNKKVRKLEEDLKLQGSNLWLVRVPDSFINESFEELFIQLIKSHKVVAIALYRKNLIEDLYYVYTNPSKNTRLGELDFVFLFGHYSNIIDLLGDREEELPNKKNKKKENSNYSSSSESEKFAFSQKLILNENKSLTVRSNGQKSTNSPKTPKIPKARLMDMRAVSKKNTQNFKDGKDPKKQMMRRSTSFEF